MCTVSFVRVNDAVMLTSNRDEHIQRENAAAPAFKQLQNKKIIFPKDARAGGTWFAAADNAVVAVLLNGAFEKHIAQPPYRTSRGLILLQLIEAGEPLIFFKTINLANIEPFTVVLYQPGFLHELRWDGNTKHEKSLDINGSYIWSSATLYDAEVIAHREDLFERFIHSGKAITATSIHDFHANNHGDAENGFVINRQTGMQTFSITQVIVQNDAIDFLHADLLRQQHYTQNMVINKATTKI